MAGKLSRSLAGTIRTAPRPGWVRAGDDEDPGVVAELRRELEHTKRELHLARTSPPPGTERLAQGSDEFVLRCKNDSYGKQAKFRTDWDEIFAAVGPALYGEATEQRMRVALQKYIQDVVRSYRDVTVQEDDFQTVKIQLDALGLVRVSTRKRSVTNTGVYWELTPFGRDQLTRLRAVPKGSQGAGAEETSDEEHGTYTRARWETEDTDD